MPETVTKDAAAQTVTIEASSDEVIPIGYPLDYALACTANSLVVPSIQAIIASAFPGEVPVWLIHDNVPVSSTFGQALGATAPTTFTIGQDRWSLVQDWSDSIGCAVWHDGVGTWHIANEDPVPGVSPKAEISTGPRGTAINIKSVETRTETITEGDGSLPLVESLRFFAITPAPVALIGLPFS